MVATSALLAGFIAAASASVLHPEDVVFAKLLKRQEPGTPAFNCHDNCGTAITLSRQPNKCDIEEFKYDYANCLVCAGPDNIDIWKYYGRTLTIAGTSCGLSTEPKSGKQPDVPAAKHLSTNSAAPSPTPTPEAPKSETPAPATSEKPTEAPTSAKPTEAPSASKPTEAPASSAAPAPASSGSVTAAPSAGKPTSGAPASSSASSKVQPAPAYPTKSSVVVPVYPTVGTTASGAPKPHTNGTASYTSKVSSFLDYSSYDPH
ncbi:uncharacterized protein K460DRAFT_283144 [Cucurbitaria berberidis CBS 394.84]|uniref:Uncharacterized protein n=1 Tax=Cucurbitaria berberidis CBS 394.84 TaxID=1168544 RepID=A0A9P4GJ37_9PLEO|nr:uncharacterized protein K460DRAFT_283144 [Cucurbitaria berberidis CBS 394.84]KAF1846055.1 hypothetical protein K460DRAFT_283144 [Cucurbitaria berberidis CBS 394.84]